MKRIGKLLVTSLLLWSCAQGAVQYHTKLQEEATFENRLGNVESFTKGSYLDDLKRLKNQLNEMEKWVKKNEGNKELISKMNEIRAMILELENQKQP